jgi:hypothetical protein
MAVLVLISAFLVGYYTQYQYLDTGYQDWMYHAFRVESLKEHGLISWDHIWSNGMNHWRNYQYLPHFMAVFFSQAFGTSLPNSMMWVVVVAFTVLRLETYILLRRLKIAPLYAFFTVVISFSFIQQWISIKDYSIFVVMPILPLFVYLWIKTMQYKELMPLMAICAGILWVFHPVLGYSAAGLLGCALFFPVQKPSFKELVLYFLMYMASTSAFFVPYFFYGYSYSNPILSLPQFLQETLVKEAIGLSQIYWLAVILSWVALFFDPEFFKRWSKILLLYCMVYVGAILFGQAGYLPSIINQLQISRGIVVVGYILPFIFGMMVQTLMPKIDRRFKIGLIAVFTALVITQSINLSNTYGGTPIKEVECPVKIYFSDKSLPTGSVFAEKIGESSYAMAGKLRFPNSYNEHIEPHPLAQRFRRLIKTDLSYSSLSATQIELIDAYVKVLGVEYVFMPKYSPTVDQLIDQGEEKKFELAGDVNTTYESFAVLKNASPVHYAYLAPTDSFKESISFDEFAKPGIRVDGFQPWDQEVKNYAAFFAKEGVQSLALQFQKTDELAIQLPNEDTANKTLLITQSHDPYWQVLVDGNVVSNIELRPTSLKFMALTLPAGLNGKTITLQHSWPTWYWPVQWFSFGSVVFTIIIYIGMVLTRRITIWKNTEEVVVTPPFTPKKQGTEVTKPKRVSLG